MEQILEMIWAEMARLEGRREVNEKLSYQETGDSRIYDEEKLAAIEKIDKKVEALDKAADLLVQARDS